MNPTIPWHGLSARGFRSFYFLCEWPFAGVLSIENGAAKHTKTPEAPWFSLAGHLNMR